MLIKHGRESFPIEHGLYEILHLWRRSKEVVAGKKTEFEPLVQKRVMILGNFCLEPQACMSSMCSSISTSTTTTLTATRIVIRDATSRAPTRQLLAPDAGVRHSYSLTPESTNPMFYSNRNNMMMDFSKGIATEVRILLAEIGKLRDERRQLQ